MATRSRRSSRGRLTDSQRDEMLIRMVDQLDSLHIRLSNVETRISQPTNESSLTKGKHLKLTTRKMRRSKRQFKHHNTLCLNGLEDYSKEDMKCVTLLEILQR